MRTSTLFDAKKSGFFEIYGVSAQTRWERERVEPLWIFCRQGGGVQFFTILYERSLWMALWWFFC